MLPLMRVRQFLIPFVLLGAVLALSSCNPSAGDAADQQVFGNNLRDTSEVVARVGDFEITRRDMELRHAEMPKPLRDRFSGVDWEKRLLRYMIGEYLLVQDALAAEMVNDPEVAQELISMRRSTLLAAYKDRVLWKDLQPDEEMIRNEYYAHSERYTVPGNVKARHIQCPTRAEADRAWEALHAGGREALFPYVVAKYSRNFATAAEGGLLGWFSRGGFIAHIPYGKEFTEVVFDYDIGLHEPVEIGGDWHIVEILDREHERVLSLNEVRQRIIDALMPTVEINADRHYMEERIRGADITYLGAFAPGQGRQPDELLRLGMMANTYTRQMELFDILLEDFPDSPEAPMALYMKANIYLEQHGDLNGTRSYLQKVLDDYPDTEIRDQVEYMLENLESVNFQAPTSIEELRRGAG